MRTLSVTKIICYQVFGILCNNQADFWLQKEEIVHRLGFDFSIW